LAYWLTPLVAGILVATIYGRFHYVMDVVAGVLLAVAVFAMYQWLIRRPGLPAESPRS
jgi:membrane-associated phospholipid phosphatase